MISILPLMLAAAIGWATPRVVWYYMFPQQTHPELVVHLVAMKKDAAKYGIDLDYTQLRHIGVANLGWIGASGLGSYPHVLIDDDALKRKSLLRELVYHEVAHSLLGCEHSAEDVDSLMHPNWVRHGMSWDKLVEQFFTEEYEQLCNN